jgi:peptidoglycan/LPS O-acetylase OafA/YrhL
VLILFTGVVRLPLDLTRLLTALATALVIAGIVLQPEGRTARVLGWSPLAYVGLVSYGLYLWHPVVFHIFEEHVHLSTFRDKAMWAPAMLGVTALLTVGSYYLVETPFNRLKDRLPRGRRLAVDAGHVEATPAPPSGGGRHRATT